MHTHAAAARNPILEIIDTPRHTTENHRWTAALDADRTFKRGVRGEVGRRKEAPKRVDDRRRLSGTGARDRPESGSIHSGAQKTHSSRDRILSRVRRSCRIPTMLPSGSRRHIRRDTQRCRRREGSRPTPAKRSRRHVARARVSHGSLEYAWASGASGTGRPISVALASAFAALAEKPSTASGRVMSSLKKTLNTPGATNVPSR